MGGREWCFYIKCHHLGKRRTNRGSGQLQGSEARKGEKQEEGEDRFKGFLGRDLNMEKRKGGVCWMWVLQ